MAEYQPIRNRNWWSKYKIDSGTVCVGQTCNREKLWLPRWELARDQTNINEEISKLQKFIREHQQFKISLGVTQITNTYRGGTKSKPFSLATDFGRPHFHRGIFRGGFSPGTEAGCSNRHLSHVTKSLFLKNLNLRKKADRNFWGSFRHLKLYSNPPSWLTRSRCHMGTLWKTKD